MTRMPRISITRYDVEHILGNLVQMMKDDPYLEKCYECSQMRTRLRKFLISTKNWRANGTCMDD